MTDSEARKPISETPKPEAAKPLAERLKAVPKNFIEAVKRPQVWGFFVGLAAIMIISLAFFYPDASMGNELRQYDMQQGAAIGHETQEWMETHDGDQPRWTNSLFSGMPTFQISPTYPSNSLFGWISTVYGAGLPSPSNLLFMMMAGMLIMLMAMKIQWYYALIGAVAWGLSSYFVILIGAGHIWKFVTLAYVPPTIAGIIMAYRGRWFTGSALAALFAMMQVQSNHVQMSYYFLFVILALVIGYLVKAVRKHELAVWTKATAALAVAAVLAVCANLPNLYNTYKYSKESMRGAHSELTAATDGGDAANRTSGLDRDYITQYSYGRAETFTLLIPNVKGGASAKPQQGQMTALSVLDVPGADDVVAKYNLGEPEQQFLAYMSQYFGEPESTNGPVYVGALIFALALLGCIIVRGPTKWALLVVALLSVLLALGRNMQWLTDLFIDYVPMYSRFRTVESILVIAEFSLPVLAVMGLYKLFTTPDGLRKYRTAIYVSFAVPAFFCLLGWLFPEVYGNTISEGDMQVSDYIGYQLQSAGAPAEYLSIMSVNNPSIAGALSEIRRGMVVDDSMRSLLFILLGFGAVMLPVIVKGIKPWMAVTVTGLLVLIDLYPVDKRYLSHDSFCTPELTASDPFPLSANDRAILQDTAMNYRVMDIPMFQSPAPSYHHKMIGGYHAAKLARYQDLIDRHLLSFQQGNPSEADFRVLNMLNAKYIITPDGQLTINPDALGNAWFVDTLTFAGNPDAEMAALSTLNPAHQAVADKKFANVLGNATPTAAGDTIFETSYAPDRLTYHAKSARGGVAVFSEVYFPWGWEAAIDGKPAEIGRVNYVLRALAIPAGEHTVEMTFRPKSVTATDSVAKVAVIAIYVLLLGALVWSLANLPAPSRKPDPID